MDGKLTVGAEADPRFAELVDDNLMQVYWGAVDHFGTTDLVLTFEYERAREPVSAHRREALFSGPNAPEPFNRFNRPASERAGVLKEANAAFWLVVIFKDEVLCGAVIATRIGDGGSA